MCGMAVSVSLLLRLVEGLAGVAVLWTEAGEKAVGGRVRLAQSVVVRRRLGVVVVNEYNCKADDK